MLTLANVIWGARCGKSARRVLLGETRSSGHAYSVRGARESAALRQAPHGLPSSRLVSTILLDLWIEQWRRTKAKGDVLVVRFADDFVAGFQHRREAERLLEELRERFAKFGLKLHPEKTRLIEFGRFATADRKARGEGKPKTFNFLGFTHCCGTDRSGKFTVIRTTMRQRMLTKLKEVNLELRRRRHQPVDEQGRYVRALIGGHVRYYGVPFNSGAIRAFRAMVVRLWKKWLSRRSQRGYLRWDRMTCYIDRWVPPAIICHPYPSARFGG